MLGQLTRWVDLPAGDGDPLEDVVDEGVHDAHGLVLEMVVSEVDLLVDEVGLLVELLASLPSY